MLIASFFLEITLTTSY